MGLENEAVVDSNENGSDIDNAVDDGRVAIESEARNDGWVPKDQYRGNPENWVDAPEFVERGKHINRILQAKNKRLEEELAEVRKGVDEFKKFSKAQLDKKQGELEAALGDLKSARAQAIREGDGDRVNELDDKIDAAKDELRQTRESAATEQPAAQQVDPEAQADFERWTSRNGWYKSNEDATRVADAYAQKLRRQGESRTGAAFLRLIDEYMRDEMPQLYTNPNRTRPAAVASGTGGASRESVESFMRSLSRDEYEAAKQMIAAGAFKDAEDFMNQYKEMM